MDVRRGFCAASKANNHTGGHYAYAIIDRPNKHLANIII